MVEKVRRLWARNNIRLYNINYKDVIKFATKKINVTKHPVFIIGQCPGRQYKNRQTQIAWEGNKSADLLLKAIEGYSNLYLTNVINYYTDGYLTPELLQLGRDELSQDIKEYEPEYFICLGNLAMATIQKLSFELPIDPDKVMAVYHPSYVCRFHRSRREMYIKEVSDALSRITTRSE